MWQVVANEIIQDSPPSPSLRDTKHDADREPRSSGNNSQNARLADNDQVGGVRSQRFAHQMPDRTGTLHRGPPGVIRLGEAPQEGQRAPAREHPAEPAWSRADQT